MDLAAELQRIYDSEINVEIGWLWDGGIDVRLGDEMNGFLAEGNVGSVDEIVPWLQEAHRALLSRLDIRPFPGSGGPGTGSKADLLSAANWRSGPLPALWCPERRTRHGPGPLVLLRALRELGRGG